MFQSVDPITLSAQFNFLHVEIIRCRLYLRLIAPSHGVKYGVIRTESLIYVQVPIDVRAAGNSHDFPMCSQRGLFRGGSGPGQADRPDVRGEVHP